MPTSDLAAPRSALARAVLGPTELQFEAWMRRLLEIAQCTGISVQFFATPEGAGQLLGPPPKNPGRYRVDAFFLGQHIFAKGPWPLERDARDVLTDLAISLRDQIAQKLGVTEAQRAQRDYQAFEEAIDGERMEQRAIPAGR